MLSKLLLLTVVSRIALFVTGYCFGQVYHWPLGQPLQEERSLALIEHGQRVCAYLRADPNDPTSDETIIIDPNHSYLPPMYRQFKPNPKLESVMKE